MGRDVAGLRIDKKPNAVTVTSNGAAHDAVHVAIKDLPDSAETKDYEHEDHTAQGRVQDVSDEKQDDLNVSDEKQDDLNAKSTNQQPLEKIVVAEAQISTDKKLSSPVKPTPGSAVNGENTSNSFEPLAPGLEGETSDSGVKCSSKSNDAHSPRTSKKSQPSFPFMSRKQLLPGDSKYHDDDDNLSLASSTATSRTIKSKVTVPVAPSFVCTDRAYRRKEFYDKLEEKHKALEQEKLEYEARTKEEELAAIKQLRKSMTYKANPVPSFYHGGPPPKPELKKLPVTRAKSPNLTRRKSFGDAIKSSPVEKGLCGRSTRHSVGIYNDGKNSPFVPKSNDRSGVRKLIGSGKAKDHPRKLKETVENPRAKELGSADISVES